MKKKRWFRWLEHWIPFGLGQVKPKHFREMMKIFSENRDNLPYAYKVLTRGVCDGCALGVAGLRDWTMKGKHLCLTRLNLLRLNTAPALDPSLLEDVESLKKLRNDELRKLGRLPYPFLRQKNEKGFRRISWDKALERMGK
ncbi:MAG TPA: formate dehydrogenase, partial [bacterium]|nr:formate dehydrogenase [bacterium]